MNVSSICMIDDCMYVYMELGDKLETETCRCNSEFERTTLKLLLIRLFVVKQWKKLINS